MGRRSKTKGSSFERLVAKRICAAFDVSARECYRTPMSGGHKFAGKADLIIGPKLRKRFPFVVECKHTKIWQPGDMLFPTKHELSWVAQVLTASSRSKGRWPLLVMRGNHTKVFAAFPWAVGCGMIFSKTHGPFLSFYAFGRRWMMVEFGHWLEAAKDPDKAQFLRAGLSVPKGK